VKSEAIGFALRSDDPIDRTNILREYIQACALRSLHESKAFASLSFVGGTALRFLFDLPRYSEDLDFSLESPEGYEPIPWMAKLKRDLVRLGFEAELSWNDRKAVQVAWIRVEGLLKEAGIVSRVEQKLAIRLEIDTRPPQGARMETRLVNRHMLFALRHHDLPSLMAGKIHALLTRPYAKGRDWYDLLWYRSRRPPVEPNAGLLEAALIQSGTQPSGNWRDGVARRLANLDFHVIRADVQPFLEHREDADLLTAQSLTGVLV
jgi:predicted nucleotidyltransferase component of viral defense system